MSSIFSFIAHRTHLKKCRSGRCGKLFLSPQVHEQRSPFTSLDVAHVDGKTGDLYLIHTGHICLLLRPCASGKSNCSYLTQPSDFLRGSMELHIEPTLLAGSSFEVLSSFLSPQHMNWWFDQGTRWHLIFLNGTVQSLWKTHLFTRKKKKTKQETTFWLIRLGKQLVKLMKAVENSFHWQVSLCTTSHEIFHFIYFVSMEEMVDLQSFLLTLGNLL